MWGDVESALRSSAASARSSFSKSYGAVEVQTKVTVAFGRAPDLGTRKVAGDRVEGFSFVLVGHCETQVDRPDAFLGDRYLVNVPGLGRAAPHEPPLILGSPHVAFDGRQLSVVPV